MFEICYITETAWGIDEVIAGRCDTLAQARQFVEDRFGEDAEGIYIQDAWGEVVEGY